MEQPLEEKIHNVIQDLEVARGYALSVGMDTMALRFHESVNTMLDLKLAIESAKGPTVIGYNNCSELQDIIINELARRDNDLLL